MVKINYYMECAVRSSPHGLTECILDRVWRIRAIGGTTCMPSSSRCLSELPALSLTRSVCDHPAARQHQGVRYCAVLPKIRRLRYGQLSEL